MINTKIEKTYLEFSNSDSMWHGFKFGRPGLYFGYSSDFTKYVADEWTVTEVGTCTQTVLDLANGVLRLTTGATEDDGDQLQLGGTGDSETVGESFAAVANKNLYFETRIKSDDVTQHDFFIGLHVQDTTFVASRGADYVGFRSDDGDAYLDIENCAGSSATSTAAISTMGTATWFKLGFKITGTDSIKFYVDDMLVKTVTANIPTELMKLSIGHLTGEGDAVQLDIDYIHLFQEV